VRRWLIVISGLVLLALFFVAFTGRQSLHAAAEGGTTQTGETQPVSASRAAREEKAIQDARRQQLTDKEAALAAKEQELKRLSEKLDAKLKTLEEAQKKLDEATKTQKKMTEKAQDEKYKKMIGMFKKMRAEQAGQLLDKLEENKAIAVLNLMDTKSVIKVVPYIKQPKVVKWINENLKGL